MKPWLEQHFRADGDVWREHWWYLRQELVGPSRIHVRSRNVLCVGKQTEEKQFFNETEDTNDGLVHMSLTPFTEVGTMQRTIFRGHDTLIKTELGDQARHLKTLLPHKPGSTTGREIVERELPQRKNKPTKTIDQAMFMSALYTE